MRCNIHSTRRNKVGAAQLFEFGSAIYLFFFAFGIPLFALLTLVFTMSFAQLATNEVTDIAATTNGFDIALTKSSERMLVLTQSGLGKLAHLHAIGGYDDSGLDIFIEIKGLTSNRVGRIGPNIPLNQEPQLDKNTYSYRVVSKFAIGPFWGDNSIVPIPYLTVPVNTSFSSVRTAEHPESLCVCVQDGANSEN